MEKTMVVAIDTEGSIERPWSLQFSVAPGTSRLIKADDKKGLALFQQWMTKRRPQVILHNSLFDLGVLRSMGITVPEGQFTDTMLLAYQLCIEPQSLKSQGYRQCAMTMQDYSDIVEEAGRDKALDFMLSIVEREWPDPEPYIVIEKGIPKVKKPHNVKRLASRALQDLASGKVDKSGEFSDLRKRWDSWDDAVKAPVLMSIGDMPHASLEDVDPEIAESYALRDADCTLRIAPALSKKAKEMGLEESLRVDHSIIGMIDRMQEVGIQLAGKEFWDGIERQCEAQMGRAKYAIYRETGAEINPASGDQVAELLYGQLHLTPPKMTPSGERGSTNDKCLETLLHEAPVVEHVMEYREADKIRGTYVVPLRRIAAAMDTTEMVRGGMEAPVDGNAFAAQKSDGRVRANFRITRVSSGRLAASDPNLLAIPIRSSLGRQIRGGFVAPEGCVLGDWDLDQIEMRMEAHDSQDKELCRLFNLGDRDIHAETASRMFGVPVSRMSHNDEGKCNDYRRQAGKIVGFFIINGGTAVGLVDQMILFRAVKPDGSRWTEDDCETMLREWFKIYPGVERFQQSTIAEAQETGLSRESISGRIRYLPAVWSPVKWIREEAERQSYSHRIQSGAQAIIKRAMAVMWKELRPMLGKVEPLLQVHDEILLQVVDRPEVRKRVDEVVVGAMCETTKLRVPVKASGGWGPNWLSAH